MAKIFPKILIVGSLSCKGTLTMIATLDINPLEDRLTSFSVVAFCITSIKWVARPIETLYNINKMKRNVFCKCTT